MGHYDEFYDAEEERHHRARRKRDIQAMQEMDAAITKLSGSVHHMDRDKMRKAFKTICEEYVNWQYSKDLLVRDPEIIIDILKDDK